MAQTQTAAATEPAAEHTLGRPELGRILRSFEHMHDYLQRQPPRSEASRQPADLGLDGHSSVTSWARHHPPPLPSFANTPARAPAAPPSLPPSLSAAHAGPASVKSAAPSHASPPSKAASVKSKAPTVPSTAASVKSKAPSVQSRPPSAHSKAASVQSKGSSTASAAKTAPRDELALKDGPTAPAKPTVTRDAPAAGKSAIHMTVIIPPQAASTQSASVKSLAPSGKSKTPAASVKTAVATPPAAVAKSPPASVKSASAKAAEPAVQTKSPSVRSVAASAKETPAPQPASVHTAASSIKEKPKAASVHSAASSVKVKPNAASVHSVASSVKEAHKPASVHSTKRSLSDAPSTRSVKSAVGGSDAKATTAVLDPVKEEPAKPSAPSVKSEQLPIAARSENSASGKSSKAPSVRPPSLAAEPMDKKVTFTASRGPPSILSSATSGSAKIVRKRIVILFDGAHKSRLSVQPVNTGGAPTSARPSGYFTNIALLAQTLKPYSNKTDAEGYRIPQVSLYLPDVEVKNAQGGPQDSVDLNVESAWAFLSDNYHPGDELYLFGFSRGAVAARVLGGLINWGGILPKVQAVFIKPIWEAYRRRDPAKSDSLLRAACTLRKATGRWPSPAATDMATVASMVDSKETMTPHVDHVSIRVIGVFDTVVQSGWQSRMSFFDPSLGRGVEHAFQALALAEERYSVYPTMWHQSASNAETQVLRQTWFQGSHGDVGGGYNHHGLSDIPLAWMVALLTDHRHGPMLSFDLRRLKRLQDQRAAWAQQDEHHPLTLDTKARHVGANTRHSKSISRWEQMDPHGYRGEAIHHSVVAGGKYSKERSPQFEWLRKNAPDHLDTLWAEATSEDSLLPTERYLRWEGGPLPLKRTGSRLSLARSASHRSTRSEDPHKGERERETPPAPVRETLLVRVKSFARPHSDPSKVGGAADTQDGDQNAMQGAPPRGNILVRVRSLSRSRSHQSDADGADQSQKARADDPDMAVAGSSADEADKDAGSRRPRIIPGFGAPSFTRPRVSTAWLQHRRAASTLQAVKGEDPSTTSPSTRNMETVEKAGDTVRIAPGESWVITVPKPTWRRLRHRSSPHDAHTS